MALTMNDQARMALHALNEAGVFADLDITDERVEIRITGNTERHTMPLDMVPVWIDGLALGARLNDGAQAAIRVMLGGSK